MHHSQKQIIWLAAAAWLLAGALIVHAQPRQGATRPQRNQQQAGQPAALPSGPGLAARYPGDAGLARDPAVLIFEDFSHGSLQVLQQRWDNVSNRDGQVMQFVRDVPPGSRSPNALQVTATLGQNNGGHLYTRLPRPLEVGFARFYVKFPENPSYLHHFVRFGGHLPVQPYPIQRAGQRPAPDERFLVTLEPISNNGRLPPPGRWVLYTYWSEMKADPRGDFWGNLLQPNQDAIVPAGRWQCMEFMIKVNTPGERDGELALWIDGELVAHFYPGAPRSAWTGSGGFRLLNPNDPGAEPFEGFLFRSVEDLKINYFWLLHYVTEGALNRHGVRDPQEIARPNRVTFANVVVAEQYIGPIAGPGAARRPATAPARGPAPRGQRRD